MPPKELSWCRGNVVDRRAATRTIKTAGVSVELPARRRPSLRVSMKVYARGGHSPYDCGIVSGIGQPAACFGGGS